MTSLRTSVSFGISSHRRKDSALFYTDREVVVLQEVGDLKKLLRGKSPILCLVDQRELQAIDAVSRYFTILDREGNTYLIANTR